jgi:hypothetical protein
MNSKIREDQAGAVNAIATMFTFLMQVELISDNIIDELPLELKGTREVFKKLIEVTHEEINGIKDKYVEEESNG